MYFADRLVRANVRRSACGLFVAHVAPHITETPCIYRTTHTRWSYLTYTSTTGAKNFENPLTLDNVVATSFHPVPIRWHQVIPPKSRIGYVDTLRSFKKQRFRNPRQKTVLQKKYLSDDTRHFPCLSLSLSLLFLFGSPKTVFFFSLYIIITLKK